MKEFAAPGYSRRFSTAVGLPDCRLSVTLKCPPPGHRSRHEMTDEMARECTALASPSDAAAAVAGAALNLFGICALPCCHGAGRAWGECEKHAPCNRSGVIGEHLRTHVGCVHQGDVAERLPPELQLRILEGVDDFSDCAVFSLASPRLGLLALRSGLARFKYPLFAVAMRRLLPQRASADHFPWIARVSPALCLSSEVEGAGDSRSEFWHLRRGEESGAKLRFRGKTGDMLHFEGARGAERRVRAVRAADGEVEHYEGEQGAERCVRAEFANGMVQHYEGEGDAERMVRAEFADGMVLYYEGERGAERRVRAEYPDGEEWYYEGERDAERLVRKELGGKGSSRGTPFT
ncbi:hypothetical protein EMIHUDRAFT_253281 [Emiliania huxleyi CCMP1516]|uniref:F-box domain-containing protein n=2 Tax=Emiliania huxleyi TaxID=2903 RepID=A0A0D3KAF8_EMIH1|nr:hypothetical protein EMIHUDRAFT_253281 [Emiliania huxleyi CCMP1516]EOD32743.1 hypothetical protein EMIHUDRAFT_253281 [Emiliania huxleyi CCMP1516]|eukprot:XP_005785172.1 hypothetical protein EMIHUDRAFT_253281 [Emiliania huxleyi CCMP1516]